MDEVVTSPIFEPLQQGTFTPAHGSIFPVEDGMDRVSTVATNLSFEWWK